MTWVAILAFIWDRLHRFRRQKTQVDQWDTQGRRIKPLADLAGQAGTFISEALHLRGVRYDLATL